MVDIVPDGHADELKFYRIMSSDGGAFGRSARKCALDTFIAGHSRPTLDSAYAQLIDSSGSGEAVTCCLGLSDIDILTAVEH